MKSGLRERDDIRAKWIMVPEPRLSKLEIGEVQKKGEDSATVVAFPEKERRPKEDFASDQGSKHFQSDLAVVPAPGV
jgi:hypothetical protein